MRTMSGDRGCCFFCNGYYDETHGECICPTCHLFLYGDEHHHELVSSNGAIDENDSGNDEPSEGQLSNERYTRVSEQPNRSAGNSSLVCIQRSLYQRVKELSISTDGILNDNNNAGNHMGRLPPEVFLIIFRHLDPLSLWSLSVTCSYFTNLAQADMFEDKWQEKVARYWPLYKRVYKDSWYNAFYKLVKSTPCRKCLRDMMNDIDGKTAFDVTEIDRIDNSRRLKSLQHDYNTMKDEPTEGVKAIPIDDNFWHWCASIKGPANSPYEGGIFFLYLQFPYVYPLQPPKIRFITKIYHPNVSRHGDIGLDCISHNWSLVLTIAKILISIQSLLTDPYCKVSMEPNIAKLYETDRSSFNRKALEWTYKYAMPDILAPVVPHEDIDESAIFCK